MHGWTTDCVSGGAVCIQYKNISAHRIVSIGYFCLVTVKLDWHYKIIGLIWGQKQTSQVSVPQPQIGSKSQATIIFSASGSAIQS